MLGLILSVYFLGCFEWVTSFRTKSERIFRGTFPFLACAPGALATAFAAPGRPDNAAVDASALYLDLLAGHECLWALVVSHIGRRPLIIKLNMMEQLLELAQLLIDLVHRIKSITISCQVCLWVVSVVPASRSNVWRSHRRLTWRLPRLAYSLWCQYWTGGPIWGAWIIWLILKLIHLNFLALRNLQLILMIFINFARLSQYQLIKCLIPLVISVIYDGEWMPWFDLLIFICFDP